MEISRKCPKKAQKASTLPRHLCPVGANGAMTKRHETVGAIAKRPLDAPRDHSGHGEGPTSSIRPPSHAWRARQDGKSGRRGASGTKRPLGRSAAPTESPLHAPRACPTLRDSLSPHAGIGGNAWGTAPRSKRRPNVGRLQYYETHSSMYVAPPIHHSSMTMESRLALALVLASLLGSSHASCVGTTTCN